MKVVASGDASLYQCCVMDKKCEGSNCMAWTWELVRDPTYTPTGRFLSPPPPMVKSGKGYCGRQ